MNCWWQGAGRAGRDPNIWAITIPPPERRYRLAEDSLLSGSRDEESEFMKIKEYVGVQRAMATAADS